MVGGDDIAMNVGMMSALRTGNPIVDMMLAMMVPLVFKKLMEWASGGTAFDSVKAVLFFWSPYHTREIEHKMMQNSYGSTSTDREMRNNVLIKAIQLYLDDRKIEYRNASVILVSTKQASQSYWADDDEGENTPAGKLKRFRVVRKPPKHVWTKVATGHEKAAKGKVRGVVDLQVTEQENDKGENAEKTQIINVYKFRSRTKGAIDTFVDEAYEWYIAELRKQEDDSRYLYEMQLSPGKSSDDEGAASRVFKRCVARLGLLRRIGASCMGCRRCVTPAAPCQVQAVGREAVRLAVLRREGEAPGAPRALHSEVRQVRGAGVPAQAGPAAARPAGHGQDVPHQGAGAAHRCAA